MFSRDVFVPNGDSRQDTAIVLVGTAEEHGINQRSIKTAVGGFYITHELAALVYDEDEFQEPEPEPEPKKKAPAKKKADTKKTSGDRAAKKDSEEE